MEKYACSVDEGVLLKFKLQKGKEIDALVLSQIQYHDEIQKALFYCIRPFILSDEIRS